MLVVRSNVSKLVGVKSVIKKLNNVQVKVDGLIFNDLDTSKASYYGYYQYGGYNNKYKSYINNSISKTNIIFSMLFEKVFQRDDKSFLLFYHFFLSSILYFSLNTCLLL